jgi:hypothetical protein
MGQEMDLRLEALNESKQIVQAIIELYRRERSDVCVKSNWTARINFLRMQWKSDGDVEVVVVVWSSGWPPGGGAPVPLIQGALQLGASRIAIDSSVNGLFLNNNEYVAI